MVLEILEGFSKRNGSVIPHWFPQLPWLLSLVCSGQDGCKSHLGSGWGCECSHPGAKELGALSPVPQKLHLSSGCFSTHGFDQLKGSEEQSSPAAALNRDINPGGHPCATVWGFAGSHHPFILVNLPILAFRAELKLLEVDVWRADSAESKQTQDSPVGKGKKKTENSS